MAKLTYLQLTNRILKRLTIAEVSDVVGLSGQPQIVTELLNEAQTTIFAEDEWYSLYTTRDISTVAGTETYAVASDFGRGISLSDESNNQILIEVTGKSLDIQDPDSSLSGNPSYYSLEGANYRLKPVPASVLTIRDNYYKIPTTLSTSSQAYDLPIECENALIYYAWYLILEYQQKFEMADRIKTDYNRAIKLAKSANGRVISKMFRFGGIAGTSRLAPPSLPSGYPRYPI